LTLLAKRYENLVEAQTRTSDDIIVVPTTQTETKQNFNG